MEGRKRDVYDAALSKIRSGLSLPQDVMNKFLKIADQKLKNYNITSKKGNIERIYKQCTVDENFHKDIVNLAENLLHAPPCSSQIDIAVSLIGLLELSRHDTLLQNINNLLQISGYTINGYDQKIKDIYPDIDSILTPDIFFSDDYDRFILELKVRNKKTDLDIYYRRYSQAVSHKNIKVAVFNVTSDGFVEIGDYKVTELVNIDPEMVKDVVYCIELCANLREKYSRFPEFSFYTTSSLISDNSEPFIEAGFRQTVFNHENYNEIMSLFGSKWDELIHDMDNISLLTNTEETSELIMDAGKMLYETCEENYNNFLTHFENNYLYKDSYNRTNLLDTNLERKLDVKNSNLYSKMSDYKPAIYIPIAKTVFLDSYGYDRLSFYKLAFKDMKFNNPHDNYTNSVINLCNSIFNTQAIDIIIKKDTEIDPHIYRDILTPDFRRHLNDSTHKYKKIATVSNITSDTSILCNNSFSINHHVDTHMKENITGFKRKHYDTNTPKKDCLMLSDCEDDLIELKILMNNIFNSKYYEGVYANDLVNVDNNNMNSYICDLPTQCRTKYLEHLYSQHSIFKSMISLNTINSHKFRLIQTMDPCTIIIMLPNSDTLKTAPLRYFTLTIIEKKDQDSFKANKLLGVAHSLIKGLNYNIILSKVISLDVTRLKLLNHSFGKYCLIMTYYTNIKQKLKHETHMLIWLLCQFITISSLSITDTYKNFIMAIYSDYSNIDNLIDDKLESRPTTIGHVFVLKQCFKGITDACSQLKLINKFKNIEELDETGDLSNTGFNPNLSLKLPISGLNVNNPKEIIQESFMLFYLGNKGLHGSPQELLKLYYTPFKFEKEYNDMVNQYGTILQEHGNKSNMSFSYKALKCTSLMAYANIYNKRDQIRQSIYTELGMEKPLLSLKQFSSTKSMLSNTEVSYTDCPKKLRDDLDLLGLEKIITESKIDNDMEFVRTINSEIYRINTKRLRNDSDQLQRQKSRSEITLLPEIYIETIKNIRFIKIKRYQYTRMINGEYIKQNNAKVFDEFYKLTDEYNLLSLKDAYRRLIYDNKLLIRIFYKDQRTADDREIYTGNAQTRLCLYPIEKTYKAICKSIPGEAITISGDQKQKKLLEQRLGLIKEKKQKIRDKKEVEIYSVSSDASKWSARDIFLKFLVTISVNPYLHPDEKWFLTYLCFRYYKKNIVLTDNIFNSMLNLAKDEKYGMYEEMTSNFTSNTFMVRSNWLQGNLNMISSFVHHCSTLYTDTMLKIYSERNKLETTMTSMVHSDDSTYDFLVCTGNKNHRRSINQKINNGNNIGKLIISLITYSNKLHCITLNEKKTYISTFYKEFLSTIIIGNELFFFYLADLLPLTSDTSYSSPLQDLSAYSGYINNAFSHACPRNMIRTAIILINHLTLSTYNMHYTADKNPRNHICCSDLPIQIYPRYKLPLEIAGMIPYYASDAFNILNDIIDKLGKFKSLKESLIEDILTEDLLAEYILLTKRNSPLVYKYLKSCVLCMDYTQYERDDADPYNIIDYDLSQKSIINVISLNKGSRLKKTYTYKKFLENEDKIRLTSAIHPEWCIKKPTDPELIKSNILHNYTNPNFRDGLIFSTAAIDYGRRVISSNRNMYTISSHVMEKDSPKNIKTVYAELDNKIENVTLTSKDLQRYLSLYLLSDKKVSMAVQLFFSKEETISMAKPTYSKVIQPRSVYSEEFGRYSNTTLIESLLTSRHCYINTVDPKVEKFVDICDYVMERIDNIKIYNYPEDIDEDYIDYYKFKYPNSDVISLDVEPITDLGDIGFKAYKNKIKYMSLLIKYYIDIKKTIYNSKYNVPNYPSPSSLIMTIDSLLKKDEISTKVYLSNIKSTKYDEYVLTRFGMYAHDDFHIKYRIGYKIKIASSSKISQNLQTYKDTVEPLSFLAKLIVKKRELYNSLVEHDNFVVGHYKYHELLEVLQNSKDINSSALLFILKQINMPRFMTSLTLDHRVYNHWLIPTNSVEDKNASLVYYMCQGNIMKVKTHSLKDKVVFTMTYYRYINRDYGALEAIKKKIASDYVELLRNSVISNKIHPCSKHDVYNINEYGRYTNYRGVNVHNVCPIYYSNILDVKPDYVDVDNHVKLSLHIITNETEFNFDIRLKSFIDDEYYLNALLDNLHIARDVILGYICETHLFHKYPEYLKPVLETLGPNQIISLMNRSDNFEIVTENINHRKYWYLSQISNHFFQNKTKENNYEYISNLMATLQLTALEEGKDDEIVRKPDIFINSCGRFKPTDECMNTVLKNYRVDEESPYFRLFTKVMKYRHRESPLEKIILFIILVFKYYVHDYVDLNDELEYE